MHQNNPGQFEPVLSSGPPRQPRMPRIGPCQVLAATLTLSQPGGQIMPTLYWGPWLAKIRRGGPAFLTGSCNGHKNS